MMNVRANLTAASLTMDPIERLREASQNIWYVLSDVGDYGGGWDEVRHHLDCTPVHEAGHAVAYALAGQTVKSVSVAFIPSKTRCGICRVDGVAGTAPEIIDAIGGAGYCRTVVATYAGGLAELRYNPARVFGGMKADRDSAERLCKDFERMDCGERYELQDAAWQEACKMFQHEAVWAATIEIADRLKRSNSMNARVSGGAVHSIVKKHLPDGWQWSGLFSEAEWTRL